MMARLVAAAVFVLLPWRAAAADPAYVVMADGGAVARVITAGACPVLRIDGRRQTMNLRAAAGTVPQRTTASTPENSKASAFPVNVCETPLPAGAHKVTVGKRRLPVPRAEVKRIIVIGDTGCRLKASDDAWQACNDPKAFPFARLAAQAAAWKPDLVIHVGDYHYRENPCPAGNAGCAGSPWGYGWDAWNADFFAPATPLFAAAPLALARGNHESCARSGQGWWRFLAAQPRSASQDCDDPANDNQGDWSPPYAVPLGRGAQLILLDLSAAGTKALAADDWRVARFQQSWDRMAALAAQARSSFAVDHYPMLGIAAVREGDTVALKPGNHAIESVFGRNGPRQLPAGVDVILSGHVHLFQQISFASDHPSQFITGFSGTLEDVVPLPAKLPPGTVPAPSAIPEAFSSWIDGFGYMTLERTGRSRWRAVVRSLGGAIINRCTIEGRHSQCDKDQPTSGG